MFSTNQGQQVSLGEAEVSMWLKLDDF